MPVTIAAAAAQPQKKDICSCYHCGEPCDHTIAADGNHFCCEGCSFVYSLLKDNGLCNYYELGKTPGIRVKGKFSSERFAYLDSAEAVQKLLAFTDGRQSQVSFYLPQMHCASCIWLLENLHSIHPGVLHSKVHFGRKEIFIAFDERTSLRKVVELLAFVGYEPCITLDDSEKKRKPKADRRQFYRIGVAGFCFSNIMMLSFPDYFSSGNMDQAWMEHLFSYLNLLLALPVVFYSASPFFISAAQGLRQRWLNIDAPIAVSVLMTFGRSVSEVLSGSGPGFFDSMSGIVFFMLVGRWFQDRTYDSFSFDRDYKSYFPLGVTRIHKGIETPVTISELKAGDHIVVRSQEMVPADAIVLQGEGAIDYSFVSGEHTPLLKRKGELVYAGARQVGGRLELQVVKPVSQSYITQLWNNNEIFSGQKNRDRSFIHPWSRYFTAVLFSIAAMAAIYWAFVNPEKILPAVTASLIVACPCSLLLSATFTFGNMLRHFGKGKLYLKNASVIESLARTNTIVFDKTGTLTHTLRADIRYRGTSLTGEEEGMVRSMARQSAHPLSRLLHDSFQQKDNLPFVTLFDYSETPGKGMQANTGGSTIHMGSYAFIHGKEREGKSNGAEVWVSIDNTVKGCFEVHNRYRAGVQSLVRALAAAGYKLHLLSGDHDGEKTYLQKIFGKGTPMHFHQTPQGKLEYVSALRAADPKARILMIGDGLNDAGALQQSDTGIAVTEATSQFTPASDAILDSGAVGKLAAFLRYARAGRKIVTCSFIISILYNIIGLSFAVQAKLSPMVAAILMPLSSITIVTFVTIATALAARRKGLSS